MQDAIGRKWQCSTIQLDFNLPERFEMEYVDAANTRQRPIMIHRALLGSIERFFGILTENYAGAFPCWLAPIQARLMPVNADAEAHCVDLARQLRDQGIRADVATGAKIGKSVRDAQMEKVPVMVVVGPRDIEAGVVSVRTFGDDAVTEMPQGELVDRLLRCNTERTAF